MNFLQSDYQSKDKHRRVKKLMTFRSIIEKKNKGSHSELGLPVVSPIFENKSLKISFKLFFLDRYLTIIVKQRQFKINISIS